MPRSPSSCVSTSHWSALQSKTRCDARMVSSVRSPWKTLPSGVSGSVRFSAADQFRWPRWR